MSQVQKLVRVKAVVVACIIACPAMVIAATTTNATWTGGSSSSNNWNDTANWVNALQPDGGGSSTIHFAGADRLTPNNDYGDYTQFNRIFFDNGASSFTLNGAAVKLAGQMNAPAKIENNSSVLQTVNFSSSGGTSLIYNGGGELDPTVGDLTINNNIYVDNNGNLDVYGNSGHTLRLNGGLFNGNTTTSLIVHDNSTVRLSAASGYGGGTSLLAGKLVAANTSGSATGSGSVNVSSGATLTGFQTAGVGGSISGSVSVSGTITAGSGASDIDSIGKLTTGNQAWNSGGTDTVKFNANAGTAGTNWDLLSMGTLSISSGFKLTLLAITGGSFVIGSPATYQIATTGTITTTVAAATTYNPAVTGGTAAGGQNLTSLFVLNSDALANIDESHFKVLAGGDGTGLVLSYDGGGVESAPEPTTACLAGLAGAMVLGSRRGRRKVTN